MSAPEKWSEAVDAIEKKLPDRASPGEEWKPADFAATAARACLENHALDRAKKLIEAGRKIEPTHLELAYLARILERRTLLEGR